jgi:purine-nucleoside phosphorylase
MPETTIDNSRLTEEFMPIHIEAQSQDVAKVVLLPGDPGRAEYIAQNFLENPKLYTEYRKMYGFTGTYKGKRMSVQTTGMGTPSLSIIIEELNMLGARSMIRVGTCGALSDRLELSDLIVTTGAHSSHDIYSQRFGGACFSGVADFFLANRLYEKALSEKISVHAGTILTSETFYEESLDLYDKFASYGTLAVEMESYALFALCSKFSIKAASVLTVSDIIKKSLRASKDVIKSGTDRMIKTVLDTAAENYGYLTGD